MLSPIHLNDQFVFQADKIEDVIAKWMLTAKFKTRNLTARRTRHKACSASDMLLRNARCSLPERIFLFVWPITIYPIPTLTLPLKGKEF